MTGLLNQAPKCRLSEAVIEEGQQMHGVGNLPRNVPFPFQSTAFSNVFHSLGLHYNIEYMDLVLYINTQMNFLLTKQQTSILNM